MSAGGGVYLLGSIVDRESEWTKLYTIRYKEMGFNMLF